MTDGEKMIWAAAFALELSVVGSADAPDRKRVQHAVAKADRAVESLRFGGSGKCWAAMIASTAPRCGVVWGPGTGKGCPIEAHAPDCDCDGKAGDR